MAIVKNVIKGYLSQENIERVVIIDTKDDSIALFSGTLDKYLKPKAIMQDYKNEVDNMEVIRSSVSCGNQLFILVRNPQWRKIIDIKDEARNKETVLTITTPYKKGRSVKKLLFQGKIKDIPEKLLGYMCDTKYYFDLHEPMLIIPYEEYNTIKSE